MATLLDAIFANSTDDPRYQANMGLFATLVEGGGLGRGLLAHAQGLAEGKARQRQSLLDELQMQRIKLGMEDTRGQMDERAARAAQEAAERERVARIRSALPGLYRQPGMTGGDAVFPETGGVPFFSQTPSVTPMRATPGGFDVQRAIELGMDPKTIQEYAGLQNIGRPKATRQMEVDDGKGGKRIALVDDFGQEVAGFAGYTAPVQVNRGDRVDFVKPAPGVSMGINMSPSERDASARGWAGHSLAQQRLAMEQGNMVADSGGPSQVGLVKQFGKPAPGYRWKQDGSQEAIPGGPADIKAGTEGAKADQRRNNSIAQADVVIGTIDDALKKAGWWETGLTGAVAGMVPGTNSYDLRKTIDTVKANIGFDALQKMREASPTGGALGQVAVQELNFLQATIANLDANQSPAQVRSNLMKAKTHYENWKKAVQQASGVDPNKNEFPGFNMTPTQSSPASGWGIEKIGN